ncbi:hypothetical protein ACFFNY_03360 [Paenibacillus hodogayensis]|uniref:Uncharacterized protein n=1 Tax=Paenibacillus hodogayensis TaxID=279208 RepID=A0ABV5VQP8_9BACL
MSLSQLLLRTAKSLGKAGVVVVMALFALLCLFQIVFMLGVLYHDVAM